MDQYFSDAVTEIENDNLEKNQNVISYLAWEHQCILQALASEFNMEVSHAWACDLSP